MSDGWFHLTWNAPYEDANNLYGYAMNQPLPVGQFQMGYGSNCGQNVIFNLNHKTISLDF